jgi:hypothetical protein
METRTRARIVEPASRRWAEPRRSWQCPTETIACVVEFFPRRAGDLGAVGIGSFERFDLDP